MTHINAIFGAVTWTVLGCLIGAGFTAIGMMAYGHLARHHGSTERGQRWLRNVIVGSLVFGTIFGVLKGIPGPLAVRPW
ncbi:hypothetical protein ABZS66_42280 [Dactylosporangium sp. NPDC005572]|uniref:hypothetical protein n=1 Tax=Dactylosporangium sp. NPDC005572 TaxID=3156889 RepID=UPI0033B1D05E